MAEAITVARPYAEAVYKLAVASNTLTQWSKMLQLAAAIAENINVFAVNPKDQGVDGNVPESRNLTPLKDVAAQIYMVSDKDPDKLMVGLNDRDTNIAIGTGYLKLVLDDFAGSMPLAAAAYNAGPSRPRAWRGQSGAPSVEAAIWAETIPFTETRDYVKKVLANTTIYAAMLSGKTQSLKAKLGKVGPRDAASPVNNDLP